ncbi:MAG: histidine kinase N-terminal 7TM domain-containing protein [Haloarculaceae archaeon]
MAVPPHVPVVLLSAIVGAGVALLAWLHRDTPGARPLTVFVTAASLWSLAEGITLASPTLGGKVFWTHVTWTVTPLVPLAWLATVLAYAEHDWRLTPRRLAALLVEPVAFVALVWTNDRHGLVWADFSTDITNGYVVLTREVGLAFWGHIAYSYFLFAVGAAVLVQLNFRTNRVFRTRSTVLLVAAFVPLLANALSVFGLVPPEYDLTSVCFVLAGVVVAVAVFRNNLLSVAPATRDLGREAVVKDIDDQVLIVDDDGRIVDLNPAAERLLDVSTDSVVGEPLASVDESIADAIADVDAGQTELELDGPTGRHYYDVRVSSLYRGYGTIRGRVVSLRDVTDRRQREQRLDVLNRLLRHNLRNEMNVVAGNAELLADYVDSPTAGKYLDRIDETVDTVVERSNKVGALTRALDDDASSAVDLERVASDAAASVRESAPNAKIAVDVPDGLTVDGGSSIELAVEELLTNAVEHHDGESPTVEVTAERTGDRAVELSVADDGPGIADQERTVIEQGYETALRHGSGVGLWLVAWVVREHGGTVEFAERDDGTTVVVRLPLVAATVRDSDQVQSASDR